MRILVACEFSGVVRRAFRALGHDAWSCDLLPAEDNSLWHYQDSIFHVLAEAPWRWDLMIAHPPCTHLAVSGARWFKDKPEEQAEALEFVQALMAAPIPRIAIENPISIISSRIRKPDQIIQPWQFGHGETKAHAFGSRTFLRLRRQKLWVAGRPAFTKCPLGLTGGRSAAVRLKALHRPWPNSGAVLPSCRRRPRNARPFLDA